LKQKKNYLKFLRLLREFIANVGVVRFCMCRVCSYI